MKITYVKRNKLTSLQEHNLGYPVEYHCKINDVPKIDLIVIACPATPETFHLINKSVIELIKPHLEL